MENNTDRLKYFTAYEKDLYEERAAIMEYDGGLTREEAENAAFRYIWKMRHEAKSKGSML